MSCISTACFGPPPAVFKRIIGGAHVWWWVSIVGTLTWAEAGIWDRSVQAIFFGS